MTYWLILAAAAGFVAGMVVTTAIILWTYVRS